VDVVDDPVGSVVTQALLVVFIFAQRRIISRITGSAVK
jgi:hypothetical protein